MKKRNLFNCLPYLFAIVFAFSANSSFGAVKSTALIVKVDGTGVAKVRRQSGVETVAGAPMELAQGDKLTTDPETMVDIALFDGTLVRVGFNSEYKIESATSKKGIVQWVFSMAKGSIRALVEKSSDKKTTRFRVNTPAGTMGVRGTELMLEHSPETNRTKLFTLHGLVNFGALNCDAKNKCVGVSGGKMSAIKVGQEMPDVPRDFNAKEILTGEVAAQAGNQDSSGSSKSKELQGHVDLLAGAVNSRAPEKMSEADLNAMMEKAKKDFQDAQNLLMGRDEQIRKLMDAARANGTFNDAMGTTDKFLSASQKGWVSDSTDPNRPISGAEQASRFKLLDKIVGSSSSGASSDKNISGGSTSVATVGGKSKSGTSGSSTVTGNLPAVQSPETNYASIVDPGAGISKSQLDALNEQIKKAAYLNEMAAKAAVAAAAAAAVDLCVDDTVAAATAPATAPVVTAPDVTAPAVISKSSCGLLCQIGKAVSTVISAITAPKYPAVTSPKIKESHHDDHHSKTSSKTTTPSAPCYTTQQVCSTAPCAPTAQLGCSSGTTQTCTTKQVQVACPK